jgi:hypothetical protein
VFDRQGSNPLPIIEIRQYHLLLQLSSFISFLGRLFSKGFIRFDTD